ncbi:MAG: hypothetical protein JRN21_03350 [Nitrososphaerota archaeon]|nr:hypothetical protein [Nitrososphaerota archaeon]
MNITSRKAISATVTVAIIVVILVIAGVAAFVVFVPSGQKTTSSTVPPTTTTPTTTTPTTTTPTTTTYGPQNSSVLVDESTGTAPDSMDPGYAFYSQDVNIINALYQDLVMYNGSSNVIVPVVASSYAISTNGMTDVFQIRPGVTFSDGTPVSGYDAWFSVVRMIYMNAPTGISFSNWEQISYSASSYSFGTFGNQIPFGLREAIHSVTGLNTAANTTAAENLAVSVLNQMLSNFSPQTNSTQASIIQYANQAFSANSTSITANYLVPMAAFGPQLFAGFDGAQVIEPANVDAHGGVSNNTANSYLNIHGGIGSGPYVVRSLGPGDNPVVLQATPNYWGGSSSQTNLPALAKPAHINTIIVAPYSNDAQAEADFGSNKAQISAEAALNYNAMYDSLPANVRAHYAFNQVFRGIGLFDFELSLEMNMWSAPTNYTSFRLGMGNAINYTALNEPGIFNGTYYAGYYLGPLTQAYAYYNPGNLPEPIQNLTAAFLDFNQFGLQSHQWMVTTSPITLSNGTTIASGTEYGDQSGTQLQPFKLYYAIPLTGALEVSLTVISSDLQTFGVYANPFGTTTTQLDILDGSKYTYPVIQYIGWGADYNNPFTQMFFPLMTPSPFNGYFTNSTVNNEALACQFPSSAAAATTCSENLYKYAAQNQIWIWSPIPQIPAGQPGAGTPTNFFFVQPYVQGWNFNQFVGGFYNLVYYSPVTI